MSAATSVNSDGGTARRLRNKPEDTRRRAPAETRMVQTVRTVLAEAPGR
ncbi:MAG: hypothetical protein Q7S97_13680 [Polaromonas sp.]|nr:hypothetical protein [Polaromonas sp.]